MSPRPVPSLRRLLAAVLATGLAGLGAPPVGVHAATGNLSSKSFTKTIAPAAASPAASRPGMAPAPPPGDAETVVPGNPAPRAIAAPAGVASPAAAWTQLGPNPIAGGRSVDNLGRVFADYGNVSGRVSSIALDPTNSQTAYLASAGGGVWKSVDGGAHWAPLTDQQATLFTSAVVVDGSGQNVYVATGDFDGRDLPSLGILRSTDAGQTWSQVGLSTFNGLFISALALDRTTSGASQRILASTSGGLFVSADAGTTWTRNTQLNGVLLGAATGVSAQLDQVLADPSSTTTFWATAADECSTEYGQVLKSVDGGVTWTTSNAFPTLASAAARVTLGVGGGGVAYVATAKCSGVLYDIEKTTNGGSTWSVLSALSSGYFDYMADSSTSGQGWYDSLVAVDPSNAQNVLFGGIDLMATADGGASFTAVGNVYSGGAVHGDEHAAAYFGPKSLLLGNDGGVYSTANLGGTGLASDWTNLNSTLGLTQFYMGSALDTTHLLGGAQDNASPGSFAAVTGMPTPPAFQTYGAGDGGWTAISPTSATIYTSYVQGALQRADRTRFYTWTPAAPCDLLPATAACNDPWSFITPFQMDPHNENRLWTASNRVYQTTTGGLPAGAAGWTLKSGDLTTGTTYRTRPDTVATMAAVDTGSTIALYTGSELGAVYMSPDAGTTWNNIAGNLPAPHSGTLIRPSIGGLAGNPANPAEAWVVIGRYNTGHVWHTTNAGPTGTVWADLSGSGSNGFPNLPALSIAVDPANRSTIYVGTAAGIFVCSSCGGATPAANWARLGSGLPNAMVKYLAPTADGANLIAWTFGRGAWSIPLGAASPAPSPAPTANWTNSTPSAGGPPARSAAAMAPDNNGNVVLFGGSNPTAPLGDTWVYNGISWAQATPANPPAGRFGASAAFDPIHHQTVMFGGNVLSTVPHYGGTYSSSETWIWDGTNWTAASPATSPSARSYAGMAFDSTRGQIILFGGSNPNSLSDTWAWTGSNWIQLTPATSPPGRYDFAMSSDSTHGQVVLFGGQDLINGRYGDTWIWNGTTWAQAATTGPSARYGPTMVSSPGAGGTVLFGGNTGVCSGETWTWNGSTWIQASPAQAPSARSEAAGSTVPGADQFLLVGGGCSTNTNEVWTYGTPPVIPAAPTGLAAQAVSASEIDLSWTASTGARTYSVKRSSTAGGPYAAVATGLTGTTAADRGLSPSTTYYYEVTATNSAGESSPSAPVSATTTALTVVTATAVQNQSYHLDSANDGGFGSWVELDPGLRVTQSPASAGTAVVTANLDVWTAQAGYNQDIGVFVSSNGGADTLIAWKESGGFAGTYSPNAAFVQTVFPVAGGSTYVFKLKWKPNKSAPAGTIYAAAGTAATQFSPTRLTVRLLPPAAIYTAVQNSSYHLDSANDGGFSSWVPVDPALDVMLPGTETSVQASANMDLWTASAGYNQDLGLFASVDGGADTLLAWKESGGFAGTYSPNAAFVTTLYPTHSGHSYTFKLKWKPNKAAPAGTLYGAAGTAATQFSPTRVTVEQLGPGSFAGAVQNSSYTLSTASSGAFSSWMELSPNVRATLTPASTGTAVLTGNMDLWTAQAGYNQDLAIFSCDAAAADCSQFASYSQIGWKESGGFAGTYSPNAATVQTATTLTAGHTYTFALGWKANRAAPAGVIYGAAGTSSTQFSPTTLTVQLST